MNAHEQDQVREDAIKASVELGVKVWVCGRHVYSNAYNREFELYAVTGDKPADYICGWAEDGVYTDRSSHETRLANEELARTLATLRAKLSGVAGLMGDGWEFEARDDVNRWVGTLNGPTMEEISVTLNRVKGKGILHISGYFDRVLPRAFSEYRLDVESINVAADKAPKQIAGDITRRLLPAYLPLLEEFKERIAHKTECHNAAETLARELASIFKTECYAGREGNNTELATTYTVSLSGKASVVRGEMTVYGDMAAITLRNMTAEQARVLATLLTTQEPFV